MGEFILIMGLMAGAVCVIYHGRKVFIGVYPVY
jgi:hypothetical protein